jgi:hypothetical protein
MTSSRLAGGRGAAERVAAVHDHLDGATGHFAQVRSPQPDTTPLIITDGRPGFIVEFWDVLGPLAHPAAHGVIRPTRPMGEAERPGFRADRADGARLGGGSGSPARGRS